MEILIGLTVLVGAYLVYRVMRHRKHADVKARPYTHTGETHTAEWRNLFTNEYHSAEIPTIKKLCDCMYCK